MNHGIDQNARPELIAAVRDAIANIKLGVKAYVFDGQRSAYRTVAVELRKLILDADSARSFDASRKAPTLFGLVFGRLDRIYLQSLLPRRPGSEREDGWVDVGPPLHRDPRDILRRASSDNHLVSLREWLKESPVRDAHGAVRNTSSTLRDIADKEGAHVIRNWGKKDWRAQAGIAWAPIAQIESGDVADLPFGANWEQFVIGAGSRLLYTRSWRGNQWESLIDTSDLPALDGPIGTPVVVQRRTT